MAKVADAEQEPSGPASASGRREQSKQETREALLAAAMSTFAEQGLEAPSLDAICARAGYTRGAFYVHFRDRDELIAAVMERVLHRLLDALIATGDAALDLERTVRAFAAAHAAGLFPGHTMVTAWQFLQACARSPELRQRYVALLGEAVERVGNAARQAQHAGTVRPGVDPKQIGLVLVGLVIGAETLSELGFEYDVTRAADAVLALLRSGKAR
jgi:TetR/AcrR family transcriptional regulator, transcriptional repressor for nem operon